MKQKRILGKEQSYLVVFESVEGHYDYRVFTGTFDQVYKYSLRYCSDKWFIREIKVA